MVLHALGGTNTSVETRYGLTTLKNDYRDVSDGGTNRGAFILALSGKNLGNGTAPAWNASPACCDNLGSGTDDVGFVTRAIAEARAHLPIDPTRIILIGESNGNFLAQAVACQHPEVVTSVIGFCGAGRSLSQSACVSSPLVSVLHEHGLGDNTVYYDGSQPIPALAPPMENPPSTQSWMNELGTLNGCTGSLTAGTTTTWITAHPNTIYNYTSCPAHGEIQLELNDLGHCTNQTYTAQVKADVINWIQGHQGTSR